MLDSEEHTIFMRDLEKDVETIEIESESQSIFEKKHYSGKMIKKQNTMPRYFDDGNENIYPTEYRKWYFFNKFLFKPKTIFLFVSLITSFIVFLLLCFYIVLKFRNDVNDVLLMTLTPKITSTPVPIPTLTPANTIIPIPVFKSPPPIKKILTPKDILGIIKK